MHSPQALNAGSPAADAYDAAANHNLFMVCDERHPAAERALPSGYLIRRCRQDELETWKRVIAEPRHAAYITAYYERVYAKNEREFFDRCFFACDCNDQPVASCLTWPAYGRVNTLGWFRVLPPHEGKGIGRALLTRILGTARYPIYLHTQPTSVCAIKLYSDFGFRFITNPIIGHRKNHLAESLPYLNRVMSKPDAENLKIIEIDEGLHRAALTAEAAEF